jgi:hypothetical protein
MFSPKGSESSTQVFWEEALGDGVDSEESIRAAVAQYPQLANFQVTFVSPSAGARTSQSARLSRKSKEALAKLVPDNAAERRAYFTVQGTRPVSQPVGPARVQFTPQRQVSVWLLATCRMFAGGV